MEYVIELLKEKRSYLLSKSITEFNYGWKDRMKSTDDKIDMIDKAISILNEVKIK